MKMSSALLCVLILISLSVGCAMQPKQSQPLQVMVLTGGHGYDQPQFEEMFGSFNGVEVTYAELDKDGSSFDDISDWNYDAMVFYHFRMPISPTSQANVLKLTEKGIGIVALHHGIAGFPDWPQWRQIVGAKYFLKDTQEDGTLWKRCTYKHDVEIAVEPADTSHPITRGVTPFVILDEAYKGYRLEPDNHLLLTASHPECQKEIGWTRTFKQSRICYIQLGHGKDAYENPAYRKLLNQAIRWTAQK